MRAVRRQDHGRCVEHELPAEVGLAAVRRPLDHTRVREHLQESSEGGVGVDEVPPVDARPAAPREVDDRRLRRGRRRGELLVAKRVRAAREVLGRRSNSEVLALPTATFKGLGRPAEPRRRRALDEGRSRKDGLKCALEVGHRRRMRRHDGHRLLSHARRQQRTYPLQPVRNQPVSRVQPRRKRDRADQIER